jgi:hypothetical protein
MNRQDAKNAKRREKTTDSMDGTDKKVFVRSLLSSLGALGVLVVHPLQVLFKMQQRVPLF